MKILIIIFVLSVSGLYAQFPIEINLNVHNDKKPDNVFYLSFGVNENAGDSLDLNLGEQSLPPYPFSVFYAAMEFIDSTKMINDSTKYYDYIRTNKDIKGIPENLNKFYYKYKLHLIWYNSNKITLNWGTTPLNNRIDSIFIKDALNGVVVKKNMKTTNTLELNSENSIDDLFFHVYYSKEPNSVNDDLNTELITITPNPVENIIKLKNNKYSSYKLYDILGNIMNKDNKFHENIDVSFLAKGLYFLYLNNIDGDFKIIKFMKN